MLKSGWGKVEITPAIKNVIMLGYASNSNIVKSKATPLYARSLILKKENEFYLVVSLDICFIPRNLHDRLVENIIKEYNLESSQIQIVASHTHAAPGGFGDKLYYEIPTPGFQPEIYKTIYENSLKAIKIAFQDLGETKLSYSEGEFDLSEPVAFNRSLAAFHNNKEASGDETISSAVNRKMYQLKLEKEEKKAVINWFGCHATSLPNYNTAIHYDNKGFASEMMEEYLGEGGVAIFAQGSCGDISPNYIFDKKLKHTRGPYRDFEKNAEENGRLQFKKSKELFEMEQENKNVLLKSKKTFFQFNKLASNDGTKLLGDASFGVSFIKGTAEGPGAPAWPVKLIGILISIVTTFQLVFSRKMRRVKKIHGNKKIFLNVTKKEFLGYPLAYFLVLGKYIDPLLKKLSSLLKFKRYENKEAWYEEELPLQLIDLGFLIIVSVPFELTTMSERRLRKKLQEKSSKKFIFSGYANSYAGYITTPEEYDLQLYEGGHTVFGRESLPILSEKLEEMLLEII